MQQNPDFEQAHYSITPMQKLATKSSFSNFCWVPFHSVACSSTEHNTSLDVLSELKYQTNQCWESERLSAFPVEAVIRLHYRSEVQFILIASKTDKNAQKVEFHIGDGLAGSWMDADYRLAGTAVSLTNTAQQIKIQGIGSYIKIRFVDRPQRSSMNPFAQVSIGVLKVWGRNTSYYNKIKNEEMPLSNDKGHIDKILMELGMPLDLLNWFESDDRNYGYAPIDEETRCTLRDMQKMKYLAYGEEDYEALKVLGKDEKEVFEIGQQIWKLRNQLEIVLGQEKFDQAIEIRNHLKELENKRRVFDALYETENYEKMIEMPPPNAKEMRDLEREWEEERAREADRFRRQMEMEEAERRRILEEEKERLRLLEEQERRLREAATQKPSNVRKFQGKRLQIIDEENQRTNLSDPLKFNEGDVDLQAYLKPLLAKIGISWEKVEEIAPELSKRLWSQGYLQIFGAKLWMAINSDNWRMREAAAQAVLNFIEMPLMRKYLDGKSLKLFLASLEVAKIACEDKILQIYFIGLKILSTALAPPVCGTDVSPKQINASLKEFLPIIISKISECNYRARDISMHTLISLFRHPAAQLGVLIQALLKDCILDPSFEMLFVPVDKQQPRIIQAKIEILLQVLQEFGYDERQWDWLDVFQYLIVPSLFHGNADVRQLTIELVAQLYQLIGEDIRNAITEIENIKPNLLDLIMNRLDQMQDLIQQQSGKGLQKELPEVKEENEELQDIKQSQLYNKSQKLQPSPNQSQNFKNNNSSQLNKQSQSNNEFLPQN